MIKEASVWVKFCVNNIIETPKNKVALDLACGSGRNSIFLSKVCYQVVSVDIDIVSLSKFHKKNIYKIQSNIEDLCTWPFKKILLT